MSAGHDVFPNAEVRVTEPRLAQVAPDVTVAVDGTFIVVEQANPEEEPTLFVSVHVARDHHGDDARHLVAQRIVEVLSQ